jgi:uncharacterized iron-regulated protein
MRHLLALILSLASPLAAQDYVSAEIVILGEIHDNPAHHAVQAEWTAGIAPAAIVFEMLTPEQATRVTPDLRDDAQALGAALDWAASGWPDFAMYHPIFTAAPQARVFGAAVPRDAARAAFEAGVIPSFGAEDAATYGLDAPLPAAQLEARLTFQAAAHCDALPAELLPQMVELQRLRDAVLARTALDALDRTGGPVVVITGNGHARKDWGMPVYIEAARPDVTVFSLGQAEDGQVAGTFDQVMDSPAVAREDPCAAFAKD